MSRMGDLIKRGIDGNGDFIDLFRGYLRIRGKLQTPGTTQVRVMIRDNSNHVLHATGVTVPTDGEAGYAKGCLFIDTDVVAGTTGLYVNVGTTTACDFDAVSDA